MPSPYEHNQQPELEPEPELRILVNGDEYFLTRYNTMIRRAGDGMFDYAMHAPDEVSSVPIFFAQPGGKELLARLKVDEFPYVMIENLDQETMDLIERHIRLELNSWIPANEQL